MSKSQKERAQRCVSCGINIAGTAAASFKCPDCGAQIVRCPKCRKQSNLFQCHDCGFMGP